MQSQVRMPVTYGYTLLSYSSEIIQVCREYTIHTVTASPELCHQQCLQSHGFRLDTMAEQLDEQHATGRVP